MNINRLATAVLMALLIGCLSSCATVSGHANASNGSQETSEPAGASDTVGMLPQLPSTSLPNMFDANSKQPFSVLTADDVSEARAIFPLVSSYTLSDEETAELIGALAAATTTQSVNEGARASVWFELDFNTGETWLLMGTADELSGTLTLSVGNETLSLGSEAGKQLVDLFGRCENSLQQDSYVMPFEGLKASDLDRVEFSDLYSRTEMTDEGLVSQLVEILAGLKVNVITGSRDLPQIYGDGGDSHLFRLTFKDGSVITVGSFEVYTCVCGIHYASKDNGLLEFYESL